MKLMNFALLAMAALTLSACNSKTSSKSIKVEIPQVKSPSVSKLTKSGYKCDLVGINQENLRENKSIFLEVDRSKEKVRLSLHDILSEDRISITGGTFDNHTFYGFDVVESEEGLSGKGVLIHKKISSLSDKGEAITGSLRISLDKDLKGIIQRSLMLKTEEGDYQSLDFEDLAEISNCEESQKTRL